MTEEHIWAIHDVTVMLIGIIIVISLIVVSFLFCNYFGGFCAVRWFYTLIGNAMCDRVKSSPVPNPFAIGVTCGLLGLVDLIPI